MRVPGIVLAALVAVSCGKSTTAPEPFNITATAVLQSGSSSPAATPGMWFVDCYVRVTLSATGDGYADWQYADQRFNPNNPTTYSQASLVQAFGSSRISGGQSVAGLFFVRYVTTTLSPARVQWSFFYRLPSGEVRSANTATHCYAP